MTGAAEDARQNLPDGIPHLENGGFEKHTNFLPDNWYCKRQVTISQEGAADGTSFAQFFNDDPGRGSCLFQGMSADSKKVKSIKISAKIRGTNIVPGPDTDNEQAAISIVFLDSLFNQLSVFHMGPYQGSFSWKTKTGEARVPGRGAGVAVIRIGPQRRHRCFWGR